MRHSHFLPVLEVFVNRDKLIPPLPVLDLNILFVLVSPTTLSDKVRHFELVRGSSIISMFPLFMRVDLLFLLFSSRLSFFF